jgi:D-aspartate ligase
MSWIGGPSCAAAARGGPAGTMRCIQPLTERGETMKPTAFERPPAVVLGLGQNGMATARALGRLGIPVIGIDSDLEQPSARTHYCTKISCPDFLNGGPGLLDCLLELGKSLNCKGVLFPSGDLNVAVVSEHRERLEPYFHYALPPKEVIQLFLNKKAFYQFAMRHSFPIPRTYFTEGRGDISDIAGEIAYPCLIKPFQPNAVWRKTFDTRLFLADSPSMLKALFDCIYPIHQDLIVQEYMPGADSQLYWGVTYLNAEGKPLAVWTGRKLRQYPRGFGTATLAESCREPWVAQAAVSVLQAMGHRGYGVVEFKKDRRDGSFKITEPTGGRTWFPHSLVTRSGINLPYIMYRDLLGQPVKEQGALQEVVREVCGTRLVLADDLSNFEEGVKWIHEERDLKTVFLYFLPEGKLSAKSWLGSYRGKRTYAYAAWDDPMPFLTSMRRVLHAGVRRLRRRLSTVDPERARNRGKKPSHVEDLLLSADPTVGRGLRRVHVD